MARLSWTEGDANVDVLRDLEIRRKLSQELGSKKVKFVRIIIRHNAVDTRILGDKVLEKKGRGKSRRTC